jgi:hypothetical protein
MGHIVFRNADDGSEHAFEIDASGRVHGTLPDGRRDALLADALALIATKWDDWGDECCPYCIDNPWHRERFTTPARSKTSPKVPKCECVCHRLRQELGHDDALSEWP